MARDGREHANNRPQPCQCELCGKRFKNANGLTQHLKTALNHVPNVDANMLACALCLRTFFRQCDLVQHLRRHPTLPILAPDDPVLAAPLPAPLANPPAPAANQDAGQPAVPAAAPAQPPLAGDGRGQPRANCPICLEDYDEGRPMHFLPCGHTGCQPCFSTAITLHRQCPHCRAPAGIQNIGRLFV